MEENKFITRPYSTRSLRVDLHKRLKILAASTDGKTLEDVLNDVIAAGLDVVEASQRNLMQRF